MTRGKEDKRDAWQEGKRTGGMHGSREGGQEGCRAGRKGGLAGCSSGGIQDRRDACQEGRRAGGTKDRMIQDSRDPGQEDFISVFFFKWIISYCLFMHINYFYRHFAAIKQHHFKDVSFLFFHLLSLSFTFKTTFFIRCSVSNVNGV